MAGISHPWMPSVLLYCAVCWTFCAWPVAGTPELGANNDGLSAAAKYIREHVWVVVVGAIGLAVLIVMTVLCYCSRRRPRGYAPLDGSVIGVSGSRGFELSQSTETFGGMLQKQRQSEREIEEESALLNCQFYLRALGGYTMKIQLNQIGTRAGKRWYLVTDHRSGQDMLMCMLGRSTSCPLTLSKVTVKTVQELLNNMRHAYLMPVLHVDYLEEQDLVTFIHPYMPRGSVKDKIYNCKPTDVIHSKYQYRGKPLNEGLIRLYGRHVLEALIFLRSRGLPPCLHLNSANIFVDGNSCLLGGYELAVFGFSSRMYPLVRRAVKDDMDALEVMLFGHFLFEMLLGKELNVAKAERHHISEARSTSQAVQILHDIFLRKDATFPSLAELKEHPFFSGGVDVSELSKTNTPPPLTSHMKSILKVVRKGKSPSSATGGSSKSKKRGSVSGPKSSRPSSRSSVSPRPNTTPPPTGTATAASASSRPPPPPSVPPPPAAAASPAPPPASGERGALLSQIHKGARLKKTSTNDRSKPKV